MSRYLESRKQMTKVNWRYRYAIVIIIKGSNCLYSCHAVLQVRQRNSSSTTLDRDNFLEPRITKIGKKKPCKIITTDV